MTYAHQIVNELEQIDIRLTVTIKDRPLRELEALDELVDVRFFSPFRAGWSVAKAKGGRRAVYRARKIKAFGPRRYELEGRFTRVLLDEG